eukprot:403332741
MSSQRLSQQSVTQNSKFSQQNNNKSSNDQFAILHKKISEFLALNQGYQSYESIVKEFQFKYPTVRSDLDFMLAQQLFLKLENRIPHLNLTKIEPDENKIQAVDLKPQNTDADDPNSVTVYLLRNKPVDAYKRTYYRVKIDKRPSVLINKSSSGDSQQKNQNPFDKDDIEKKVIQQIAESKDRKQNPQKYIDTFMQPPIEDEETLDTFLDVTSKHNIEPITAQIEDPSTNIENLTNCLDSNSISITLNQDDNQDTIFSNNPNDTATTLPSILQQSGKDDTGQEIEEDVAEIDGMTMTQQVREDKEKLEIIKQLVKMELEQEQMKHKLNNDQRYINLLHEYNYLKDACFQLVEIVANVAQVPVKEIFEQYDVRDIELDNQPDKSDKQPEVKPVDKEQKPMIKAKPLVMKPKPLLQVKNPIMAKPDKQADKSETVATTTTTADVKKPAAKTKGKATKKEAAVNDKDAAQSKGKEETKETDDTSQTKKGRKKKEKK